MENQEEIWKDIIGYEGFYMVSSVGSIMSLPKVVLSRTRKTGVNTRSVKSKLRKPEISIHGYNRITLSAFGKNKRVSVHRLVATHFIPNPLNKPAINHKNGVRMDNRVENLEWVTNSENVRHCIGVLGKKGRGKGRKSNNKQNQNELYEQQ